MLFHSAPFLVFLAFVLTVVYTSPHRVQNAFLLAASLFFYACWDWRFLAPLLFTTSLDYWCAARMSRPDSTRRRKPYLLLSVVANVGMLAFFKYSNLSVLAPIGISFYTFQALSYTIDVYRRQLHASAGYFDFLLAVVYFPHLVAGPIQRAASLLPQVTEPRTIRRENVMAGLHLMVWGYFKKSALPITSRRSSTGLFQPRTQADGTCSLRCTRSTSRSIATFPATPTSRAASRS